ncbi:penicillin-binding protein 2 [Actinotalea sp. M2MS4P-6]|uniref:peptidoglycan D,D-transpeptidase FtsI family protein n=1 Tax=Actinotalea sp. M2MS4P-6 TaxID=2983762 RepID=UPI0021E452BE|nr:penicillin-binding protein 2 [Actinotalea sp. M2MS4P-6]MCV2393425.1 penicillin-binding protein 2 [Actinotalea sp. M2MS4P-6]
MSTRTPGTDQGAGQRRTARPATPRTPARSQARSQARPQTQRTAAPGQRIDSPTRRAAAGEPGRAAATARTTRTPGTAARAGRRANARLVVPARAVTATGPRRRHAWLLAGVLVVLAGFIGRLVYVQGLDPASLAQEALDFRTVTVAIPGDRGEILDASGVVLATSVERYNIVANQPQVAAWKDGRDSVAEAAALLSPLLGIPATELGASLLGDRGFVYLAKDVAPDVYREVMSLGIAGISGERTTERVYPSGTTAGTLLGFVGTDGTGLAGLEQTYDSVLSGTAGSETYEQGRKGQRIPSGRDELVPAVPGRDVQLTIDRDLQYVTQAALDQRVREMGAEWGTVEVLDIKTGEILALADSGSIDPNDPANANPSRAAASVYEPGSTAKVITMAAVLENGLATPTSQFSVPYSYTVPNGETFHDSHEHPTLNLTLNGILAESSNVGTVMIGQNLPAQVRLDYLAKFGFGTSTNSGLPGESAGLLRTLDEWNGDGRSPYTVLFGQSVSVTTLQATQVYATIANHGVRVQPHLVAAVEDADGTMQPVTLDEPTQVISTETADTLVRMLESVVTDGTGAQAAVPGYRIAGKTGTAQAFEGNGVQKTVASFIGIAPADDPRIVVNVTLYHPRATIYGGSAAGPVFSEVTAYALQYLGIPPSGVPADPYPTTWE